MKHTNSLDFDLHKKALGLYTKIEKDQLKNITPAPITEINDSDMTFTRGSIRGVVMKRIENFQFYHSKSEHAKTMWLDFNEAQPYLHLSSYNTTI
jgi:hypothetical protein